MTVKWTFLSISAVVMLIFVSASLCLADFYPSIYLLTTGETKPIADPISITTQKSPTKAFLFSATVPGTGELYSGSMRGIAFIVTEVAFWSAYVVLHGRAADLENSYTKYVDDHITFEDDSPVKSTKSWNPEDYEHATQTGNWHYIYTEKDADRLGKFYWKDLPKDKIDEPGEDIMTKYRAVAYSKRGSSNKKYKQAKICLSLIVANHVASAIDARISAMLHNKKTQPTTVSIHPFVSSNNTGVYVVLNHHF